MFLMVTFLREGGICGNNPWLGNSKTSEGNLISHERSRKEICVSCYTLECNYK
jgi:hypothetical protein